MPSVYAGGAIRYPRAVVPHALPALRSSRHLLALLFAVLAFGAVGLTATPVPASAQLIDNTPQTKEEARAAREAADSKDDGGSVPIGVWLALGAFAAIGAATFFIFRDAGHAVGSDVQRGGPVRPPVDPKDSRGVPKQMFEGEGSSSNPHGKVKKREKGKRQKQARRANRPRR